MPTASRNQCKTDASTWQVRLRSHFLQFSCLCLMLSTQSGLAGEWQIGSASGYPGEEVEIELTYLGDGETVGSFVDLAFDEAKLTLPVESGMVGQGTGAGECARIPSNSVAALYINLGSSQPLPSAVVCRIPFIIQPTAISGETALLPLSLQCTTSSGSAAPCSASPATVTVLGETDASPPEESEVVSLTLAILLAPGADAPRAEEVAQWDRRHAPESSPIAALREIPPSRIRPLVQDRPRGDFRRRLEADPGSPEARLDRYVLAEFDTVRERDRALQVLRQDPNVEHAYVDEFIVLSSGRMRFSKARPADSVSKSDGLFAQFHLNMHGLPAAWQITGGWGLIGASDNGLDPDHPDLRSFTGPASVGGTFVQGGNYLPYFSKNFGGASQPSDNLSETQPNILNFTGPIADICDTLHGPDNELLEPPVAGHGTHVAGLIGANGRNTVGVSGSCLGCGIAVNRHSFLKCQAASPQPVVRIESSDAIVGGSLSNLFQTGMQVVNFSGAFAGPPIPNCGASAVEAICLSLSLAQDLEVVVVASSGNAGANSNGHSTLDFPARDPRVIAAGGTKADGTIWQFDTCPTGAESQCGSNFESLSFGASFQELMAPAVSVRSTFFPIQTWNQFISCGDGFGDGTGNDGYGMCTGTSMSAPIISGIVGLVRSVNPLVPAGSAQPQGATTPSLNFQGIRGVLAQTASAQGYHYTTGYGLPLPAVALRKMLGIVQNEPVRQRVTPLNRPGFRRHLLAA